MKTTESIKESPNVSRGARRIAAGKRAFVLEKRRNAMTDLETGMNNPLNWNHEEFSKLKVWIVNFGMLLAVIFFMTIFVLEEAEHCIEKYRTIFRPHLQSTRYDLPQIALQIAKPTGSPTDQVLILAGPTNFQSLLIRPVILMIPARRLPGASTIEPTIAWIVADPTKADGAPVNEPDIEGNRMASEQEASGK